MVFHRKAWLIVSWCFTVEPPSRSHRFVNKTCPRDYSTSRRLLGAMEGFEGDRINTPFAVE